MFELIVAGGWVMVPLLLCSVITLGIVLERFWSLQRAQIAPDYLFERVRDWHGRGQISRQRIDSLRTHSPLGRVFAAGLSNQRQGREIMQEAIEEAGRRVVFELERFLTTLGTIATIAPLLGLLGTVLGMIQMFTTVAQTGTGGLTMMSSGIAQALVATATGLFIAVPAVVFHRYFRTRVTGLVLGMELEAIKLIDLIQGARELPAEPRAA